VREIYSFKLQIVEFELYLQYPHPRVYHTLKCQHRLVPLQSHKKSHVCIYYLHVTKHLSANTGSRPTNGQVEASQTK